MKLTEHNIFPIPTRIIDLDEDAQKEIQAYYESMWDEIEEDTEVKVKTTWGREQPLPLCPKLIEAIGVGLDGYIHQVDNMNRGVYIEDYWFQEYKHGGAHMPHHHPASSISGVYYIESNNLGSPLVFYNPNSAQHFMNYATYSSLVECWQGRLVLFPSWLLHGVPECRNEETHRRVVAFNIAGSKTLPEEAQNDNHS